jgi:hypothetical protein
MLAVLDNHNKAIKAKERDDRKVSWAAIAPPKPCHSMAWSGGTKKKFP